MTLFEHERDDLLKELRDEAQPEIRLEADAAARTITVHDNGIGMSKDEVVQNIGTIARSGTREFFQSLSGDQAKDAKLIGQFGVGFYSAFMVADKVEVVSRRAGEVEAHRWSSDGKGEFTVASAERDHAGTDVILHLKKDEDEFLADYKIRDVVRRYSDHVPVPIELRAGADKSALVVHGQSILDRQVAQGTGYFLSGHRSVQHSGQSKGQTAQERRYRRPRAA